MAGRIAAAGTGQVEHEDGEVKAVRHYGGESLRHRRYVTPDEGVIVERIGDRDQRSELIAQKERRGVAEVGEVNLAFHAHIRHQSGLAARATHRGDAVAGQGANGMKQFQRFEEGFDVVGLDNAKPFEQGG